MLFVLHCWTVLLESSDNQPLVGLHGVEDTLNNNRTLHCEPKFHCIPRFFVLLLSLVRHQLCLLHQVKAFSSLPQGTRVGLLHVLFSLLKKLNYNFSSV